MKLYAVMNLKGGTAKTTTAVSLGSWLAQMGIPVLLVDLDPQGSLTKWLGIDSTGAAAQRASTPTASLIHPHRPRRSSWRRS